MEPAPITPAANAVAHGLTAKKHLPASLAAAVTEFRAALFEELKPQGPLAEILVAELARHGAAMQFAEQAEAAALRTAESNSTALDALSAIPRDDLPYVAAMSSELVERTARYRRQHERSFFAALGRLRESLHARPIDPGIALFSTEDQAAEYLADWQQKQKRRCLHCNKRKFICLRSRSAFECAACGKQYSNRWGTVLANSHVPLLAWFTVIECVVLNPKATADELAERLPIARRATIANLIRKVSAALAAPNADQLLAGVNRHAVDRVLTWSKCHSEDQSNKTNDSRSGK